MPEIPNSSAIADYARGAIFHINRAETDSYVISDAPVAPQVQGLYNDATFHLAWGRDDLLRTAQQYGAAPDADQSLVQRLMRAYGAADAAAGQFVGYPHVPNAVEDGRQAAYQVLRNIGAYPLPD